MVIWATSVTDPDPLGAGKVGFYNYSQQNVEYELFSDTLFDGSYRLTATSGDPGLRNAAGEALDGNDDGEAGGDFVGHFRVDRTPPRVADVNMTRGSDEIEVTYSERGGIDTTTVLDPNNYNITHTGGDGLLDNGNDATITVSQVVYDAGSGIATLTLAEALGDELYSAIWDRLENRQTGSLCADPKNKGKGLAELLLKSGQ